MDIDRNGRIDILLATYNGERYIDEQIKSLLLQTNINWKLIIRDDGSTDNTVNIIDKYANQYPDKISVIRDKERNLGPARNFSRLLNNSTSQYIMFCDQDDIWKPEKIEITLREMQSIEKDYFKNTPILIHTDLEVVDGDLNQVSPSMFKYQKLNANYRKFNQILIQNNVTGCTVMINKDLADLCKPIPDNVIMHDWWIALYASAFGKIGFVDYPTIKYRQHGNNDVGAKEYSLIYFYGKMRDINNVYKIILKSIKQAELFYRKNKGILSKDKLYLLENLINIPKQNSLFRLYSSNKNKFFKQGFIRNLGYHFLLITMKKNYK